MFAASSRFTRLLIRHCGIEHVIVAVLIVVPDPNHREGQALLVAALGDQVEELVGPHQSVKAASIRGVGMKISPASLL